MPYLLDLVDDLLLFLRWEPQFFGNEAERFLHPSLYLRIVDQLFDLIRFDHLVFPARQQGGELDLDAGMRGGSMPLLHRP